MGINHTISIQVADRRGPAVDDDRIMFRVSQVRVLDGHPHVSIGVCKSAALHATYYGAILHCCTVLPTVGMH